MSYGISGYFSMCTFYIDISVASTNTTEPHISKEEIIKKSLSSSPLCKWTDCFASNEAFCIVTQKAVLCAMCLTWCPQCLKCFSPLAMPHINMRELSFPMRTLPALSLFSIESSHKLPFSAGGFHSLLITLKLCQLWMEIFIALQVDLDLKLKKRLRFLNHRQNATAN